MNPPVKHDVPDEIRDLFTELREFVRSKSPIEIAQESGLAEGTAHRLRYGDTYPTRLTNKNRRLLEAYRDRLRAGRFTTHHYDSQRNIDTGPAMAPGTAGDGVAQAPPTAGIPTPAQEPLAVRNPSAQRPAEVPPAGSVSTSAEPLSGVRLAHVEHYLTRIGLFVKSQRHALDAQRHVLDRIESDIRALSAVLRAPAAERLELPEMKWLEQTFDAAIRAHHAFESMESARPFPGEAKQQVATDG